MGFAERLRMLRQQRGLSQQELAKKLGISGSAISMYERGERTPDFELLDLICDFFNVDTDYILGKEIGSTYYLDPEAAEMANELFHRPEMRVLFDASRKLTKEDIEMVTALVEKMSGK